MYAHLAWVEPHGHAMVDDRPQIMRQSTNAGDDAGRRKMVDARGFAARVHPKNGWQGEVADSGKNGGHRLAECHPTRLTYH